ncbi:MAG: DUF1127 domain-containing protein [Roseibium sp.]|nr:DUF1127 domain-containing protein [Roseibium sp.]
MSTADQHIIQFNRRRGALWTFALYAVRGLAAGYRQKRTESELSRLDPRLLRDVGLMETPCGYRRMPSDLDRLR